MSGTWGRSVGVTENRFVSLGPRFCSFTFSWGDSQSYLKIFFFFEKHGIFFYFFSFIVFRESASGGGAEGGTESNAGCNPEPSQYCAGSQTLGRSE